MEALDIHNFFVWKPKNALTSKFSKILMNFFSAKMALGHKKLLYVSEALPASPSTHRIKNFYCISTVHIEKSSIHRELSV